MSNGKMSDREMSQKSICRAGPKEGNMSVSLFPMEMMSDSFLNLVTEKVHANKKGTIACISIDVGISQDLMPLATGPLNSLMIVKLKQSQQITYSRCTRGCIFQVCLKNTK